MKNKMTNTIIIASEGTLGGALRLPNSRLPVEVLYGYYKVCLERFAKL